MINIPLPFLVLVLFAIWLALEIIHRILVFLSAIKMYFQRRKIKKIASKMKVPHNVSNPQGRIIKPDKF